MTVIQTSMTPIDPLDMQWIKSDYTWIPQLKIEE